MKYEDLREREATALVCQEYWVSAAGSVSVAKEKRFQIAFHHFGQEVVGIENEVFAKEFYRGLVVSMVLLALRAALEIWWDQPIY